MKIIEYEYSDPNLGNTKGWHFSKVELKNVNLLVGDTGTGKTRFLTSLFNLGRSVVRREFDKRGEWAIKFKINNKIFLLNLLTIKNDNEEIVVAKEEIIEITNNTEKNIVKRDSEKFIFEGKELPKLPGNTSSISLLKNEKIISEIHEGFSTILRRIFGLESKQETLEYSLLSFPVLEKIENDPNLGRLFHSEFNLSVKLYIAQKFFKNEFAEIKSQFIKVFPFIEDVKVIESIVAEFNVPGIMPAFTIKEKNVSSWIDLKQLSSGMQKVLIIITDLVLFPRSGIYLIDEYENSLGVSAINFFPEFILSIEKDIQFIITSHHPYLINKIPIDNWYLFNRQGSNVVIKYGNELIERYGKSKQEAFVQLLNDKFYKRGIE